MGIFCEMCIKLHLEEQTTNGLAIEKKEFKSKLFNLNENCFGTTFENKSIQIFKDETLGQSDVMSPE